MTLSLKQANRIILGLTVLVVFLVGFLVYAAFFPLDFTVERARESDELSGLALENLDAVNSPFLQDEEVVVLNATTTTSTDDKVLLPIERVLFEYVEVVDSCGPHYEGDCLVARSGPGQDYSVLQQLRNGMVLKVGGQVERDGQWWYKIIFDEWLRYPERVEGDWYVAADYVRVLLDEGDRTIWEDEYATGTQKSITVDRSEQMLYAFEGNELFLETAISTGLELTPTPRGTFTIFKKTPSRYMQGPLPNLADQQRYDLPGVPWNLYFTEGGAVIHGAYWHDSFGSAYSHGCVNVEPSIAQQLYSWAELGTKVIVKD